MFQVAFKVPVRLFQPHEIIELVILLPSEFAYETTTTKSFLANVADVISIRGGSLLVQLAFYFLHSHGPLPVAGASSTMIVGELECERCSAVGPAARGNS